MDEEPKKPRWNNLTIAVPSSLTLGDLIIPSVAGRVQSPSYVIGGEAWADAPDLGLFTDRTKLNKEISDLRQKVAEQSKALTEATSRVADKDQSIAALQQTTKALDQKVRLGFLLDRVGPDAQHALNQSEEFRQQFLGQRKAFVMAVESAGQRN